MTDHPVTLVRRWCRWSDEDAFSAFYQGQSERLWRFPVAPGVGREAAYDVARRCASRRTNSTCCFCVTGSA